MATTFLQVDNMKHRLERYRDMNRDIELQMERIEYIRAKMAGVGAQQLSDMPKGSGGTKDRLAIMMDKVIEIEKEVKRMVDIQAAEKPLLDELVRQLDYQEKALIQMYYLDGVESWEIVTAMLWGRNEDFEENPDNYKRRLFRLKEAAIQHIADL